jgi:hypothetical protein
MECAICKQRSGKRFCPGVNGYICALCCGREREVSIDCPFECPHLQDAYRHQRPQAGPPPEIVYKNHEVSDDFVREHEDFVAQVAVTLLRAADAQGAVVDADLRAVLDALVRTYETISSGLIYETLPQSLAGTAIYRDIQKFVEDYRKEEAQRKGMVTLRDGDILKSLVFLGRTAQPYDSGRPRGRAFLAFLRRAFPVAAPAAGHRPSGLIVPGT